MVSNSKSDSKVAENEQGFIETSENSEIEICRKRWCILALYVFYMLCNSSQWLQYSMIPNAIIRYYGVTSWHVNLTSLVMMGCYLPLALPAANLMNRISLRWTAILGSTGTAIGSLIKLLSVSPNGFYVTLAGQTVVAISQVLMLSVPQKLSSIWFGEREVSSACSIGVFGFQLGIVVGFFLPPIIVKNHEQVDLIGGDLRNMFIIFAVISTVAALLVFFVFESEPEKPPTISQAKARIKTNVMNTSYLKTLKRLFSQKHLVALFITTGINNGCFNGFSTLLSQIYLEYFPGHEEDAGRIGVTMVVFGMLASITFGLILDRTKQFKLILIFIFYMSAVGMALFTVLIVWVRMTWAMYLAAAFVGTFLCGFTAASFDVATEVTYPESELIVGTIMNMMSLLFTFAATLVFGYINDSIGFLWGNIGFTVTLAVGATMTIPIRFEHKRTNAQKQKECKEKQSLYECSQT